MVAGTPEPASGGGRIFRAVMARILSFLKAIIAHPVARVGLALVMLFASVGGLSLVAYGDGYANGGVTWGKAEQPVPLADVNPMGVNLFLEKEVERANVVKSLEMARDGGFKWIRQGFAWNDIEISGKGIFTDTRNGVEVSAWDKYDFIVDEANKYGLEIMARLDSPPVWARFPYDDIETYHKGPPRDNNDYGDFVAAVAARYKGKIKYFQIWNEPNLIGEWGGHPVNAEEYVALLKVAHDRIKAVNPEAVIITAALAPTTDDSVRNRNDILYLDDMYRAGAAPYFDVLSTMLYSLGQPPDDRRAELKRLNFSRPILLREVMERYGDVGKPLWISEYAWISLPPDFAGDPTKNIWGKSVDEETQGRYLVEGYERAREEWPWMGVMFVWHLRNPDGSPLEPATWFSILNADFSPRPAYTALKEYGARVPDVPTPQDKPLWNLVGFPLLYIIFGALSLASAGYTLASLGRWASAALDRPRGRFSEEAREVARNGAAIAGMVLLFGLYYRAGSLPLIAVGLAGWWLIALLKPSTGLAIVAFAIPFFWYPKVYGSQRFPVAETMLLLVFGAVLARRVVVAFLPGLAIRLRLIEPVALDDVEPQVRGVGGAEAEGSSGLAALAAAAASKRAATTTALRERTVPMSLLDAEATQPMPVSEYEALEDGPSVTGERLPHASASDDTDVVVLRPPRWPKRPNFTATDEVSQVHDEGVSPMVQAPESVPPPLSVQRPAANRQSFLARLASYVHDKWLAWNAEDAFGAPAVVMLLLGALSLLTLANPEFAPDSARAYRWTIIEPVLFYFLITEVIKGRRGLLRLLDFFMLGAVVVALYGLWQFARGGTLDVEGVSRIVSVYEHPNNLGLYLGRVAPFAACMGLFLPWGWRKALYGLAALPLGLTLLLTFSRGAWIGAVVAIVVAVSVGLRWKWGWIQERVPRTFRLWLVGLAAGVVLLVVAGAILFPKLPARVFSANSGVLRLTIWGSALHMGADHALFGIGLDQFLNQFQTKYGPCVEKDGVVVPSDASEFNECYTAHPHNIFLDYWLSLGIMGLFALLWLLWRYYRESINLAKWAASKVGADALSRAVAVGMVAVITDFLVHGLIDNSYFLMDLALIFWMCCGVVQLLRRRLGIIS